VGYSCHSIRKAIQAGEADLRKAHPWLQYQDLIAASLLVFSLGGFVMTGVAYYQGMIPAWLCIVTNAFLLSIGHEIEHDLIHQIYFARQKFLRDVLFAVGWLSRCTTISPWVRTRIHHFHHKHSGELKDAEEGLIGNGLDYKGIKRWLVMLGPWAAPLQAKTLWKHGCPFRLWPMIFSLFPMVMATTVFVLYWGLLRALGPNEFSWGYQYMPLWNALMVGYVAPNMLRMFCLQFISSTIHYFEDVQELGEQTQVFNAWYWLPLQIFCFNFGATHALHHIFPNQPFYIRQWLAPRVYPVMRANGIRFNDVGTFARNNRYRSDPVI